MSRITASTVFENWQGIGVDTARVTSKGQVTIPKRVRTLMAIEAGDHLAFELHEDGSLHVNRVQDERRPLRGLLSEYAKPGMLDGERGRVAHRARAATKCTVR